jgi:hypothetical protein
MHKLGGGDAPLLTTTLAKRAFTPDLPTDSHPRATTSRGMLFSGRHSMRHLNASLGQDRDRSQYD